MLPRTRVFMPPPLNACEPQAVSFLRVIAEEVVLFLITRCNFMSSTRLSRKLHCVAAAFVLNFEIPRCRVNAAKYDDARATPRPESCCQMPPNASTVAAACAEVPRTTSWRSGRCEGTKTLTHAANALLVGSSPYKKFVAVPHWHHPSTSHNVTTMSLCPTLPSDPTPVCALQVRVTRGSCD